jgi:membrane dipeptidase
MRASTLFLALALAVPLPVSADASVEQARKLVLKYPLVDGHIDVPHRIYEDWADVTGATEGGDFDYPRAVAGGLNAPFMSIYTPAESEQEGTAYALANVLIDQVEAIVARAPHKFAIATSVADVRKQFDAGIVSLALGMENGAPIAGDLDNLHHFYRRGVRYVTLAHSLSNHISDSSYDEQRPWQGLSPFGKRVVAEMNDLGMMVDISHLSDAAAQQVLALSRAPVIASHSSARKFVPGFERNMGDELIAALAENGGIIMINFGSSFVSAEANAHRVAMREVMKEHAKAQGGEPDPDAMRAFAEDYLQRKPFPYADVSQVADHIDHVRDLVGVEHIGLGSDYDGVGDTLPEGLKDVSTYPALVAELLRRDYSEQDIAAILGGNALRVWSEVEQAARPRS